MSSSGKEEVDAMKEKDPDEWIAVTLETDIPSMDEEVLGKLEQLGARSVSRLSPRFYSARIRREHFGELKSLCRIQEKRQKRPHR